MSPGGTPPGELNRFLDGERRVSLWPARLKHRMLVLRHLASRFDRGRTYTEPEVNAILTRWHTFGDWAGLRRALCDFGFLERTGDGSRYWIAPAAADPPAD